MKLEPLLEMPKEAKDFEDTIRYRILWQFGIIPYEPPCRCRLSRWVRFKAWVSKKKPKCRGCSIHSGMMAFLGITA